MKIRNKFNGVLYDIELSDPVDGLCEDPKGGKPSIMIFKDLGTKEGLETAIHEGIHASHWRLREETVNRMGKEITSLLWKLGFRLQKRKK